MSFLEDLIGSFAKAGADVTGDITKDNQREREMQLQNDLALQRQRAAEQLRIQLEDERAAAKQKRISDQQAEIEAAAPAVTAARQLGEAQGRAPSVDSNVLDVIKSKLTPAQLKQFYGVDTGAVAGIDDRLGIARQRGFYDAEAGLKAARTETVAALKDEFTQQRQLYRDEQTDRRDTERERANREREAAMWARIDKAGSGSSADTVGKLVTEYDSARKAVKDAADVLKNARGDQAKKDAQADLDAARKHRDRVSGLLETARPGSTKEGGSAAPTGYPDGTKLKGPGGKTYVVKNGVPVPQ